MLSRGLAKDQSFSGFSFVQPSLRYISPGLQERKEHMLNCRGTELDYMLDQLCPNRGNCHSRDVAHWATFFH